MGLPSHTHNPLILQAEYYANMLSEKANITGQNPLWEKLHVSRTYPSLSAVAGLLSITRLCLVELYSII